MEITGPVDRKMVINALNSGANVYMADFEDSNAPTWSASACLPLCSSCYGMPCLCQAHRAICTWTRETSCLSAHQWKSMHSRDVLGLQDMST